MAAEQPTRSRTTKPVPGEAPPSWLPALWDESDAHAIRALNTGTATAEQQQRALAWIINTASDTYGLSFRPGPSGDRETSFAEGKRSVGLQIVKLLNLNLNAIRKAHGRAESEQPG